MSRPCTLSLTGVGVGDLIVALAWGVGSWRAEGVFAMLSYVSGTGTVPLLGETIGAALNRTAARFGNRDALISCPQNLRYSYTELLAEVDRAARAFLALGIRKGDRIG